MKKTVLIGVAIIVFILLFFNKDTLIYNYHTSSFDEITTNEFYELVEEEEEKLYFVYFGRSTCPYCRDFVDDLSKAAKESGRDIHYINTENTAAEPELKALRDQVGVALVPSLVRIDSKNKVVELLDITKRQREDLLLHFR